MPEVMTARTDPEGGRSRRQPPSALPKTYDPAQVEERVYALWERGGYFRPRADGAKEKGRRPFTIIMPPPNLTGELHLGHALVVALEDALTRWHRMLGDDTLWLPGVDHAAIAVNAIVERQLADEGRTRHDVGREAFLARVWDFVNRSRSRIAEQHRRLGASADWTREAFTMDPGPQRAVRQTFKRLYDDGLIYRGERLINWDPEGQTALSDLEVDYREVAGHFWYVRYPLLDAEGGQTQEFVTIATTRPETIPADTAVAVNPADERYRSLIGRRVLVPTSDRPVAVIADAAVSMKAGSGALKVTPAHDPLDFEIGERHGLEILNIMNPDATLNERAGAYAGLDRFEARDRVVADLEAKGLIEKVEPYTHAVGHSQRSGAIVEPMISLQWFVSAKPLAQPAIAAVRDGRIRFVPDRFARTYLQWMDNIRDWCISRQIWWGHRIPVWYCDACAGLTVAVQDPTACDHCGDAHIRQDEDTLDTWFSSGLWPHSTLGWPDDSDDLRRYYPTQVMETAYDIIFFWVARMIMLSMYNMRGVPPFETVYLHGLVRAQDGHKMSKSLGNVIDPLKVIDRYGTDALRFTLVTGPAPGNDMRLTDERLEGSRNFANKLWNGARFVLGELEAGERAAAPVDVRARPLEDRWILSRLARLTRTVQQLLDDFQLGEAGRQIHDFLWSEFFDWYVEASKPRLRRGDRSPLPVLVYVLDRSLRLLHPFMPFVTEEIWQRLRRHLQNPRARALIAASYPSKRNVQPALDDEAERAFAVLQNTVRAIRQVRAEKKVEPGRWVPAYVIDRGGDGSLAERSTVIEVLARARPLHIVSAREEAPSEGVVAQVLAGAEVVLPLGGLVDAEQERARLQKEVNDAQGYLQRVEAKLGNDQFRRKAPADVVAREERRRDEIAGRLAGLRERMADLP